MAFSGLFSRELYEPLDYQQPAFFRQTFDSLLNPPVSSHLIIRPTRQASADVSAVKSAFANDPNKFQVMLNVKHFRPEELNVKTVDNHIVIHGKHEETADEHGFVSREFTRRYALPEGVEPRNVSSSLSQDGVLTIQAPKKQLQPPPKNERNVPITMQQPASAEDQQLQQDQNEEK